MSGGTDQRILIIEDDPAVSELLTNVLKAEGYQAAVAADGLEGLLRLRTGQPDAAVLDIMMPDINGVRVLEQLLEEGGGELEVPVLVITGSSDAAATSRRLLGDENVFEKPFDPDALLERLAALIAGDPA